MPPAREGEPLTAIDRSLPGPNGSTNGVAGAPNGSTPAPGRHVAHGNGAVTPVRPVPTSAPRVAVPRWMVLVAALAAEGALAHAMQNARTLAVAHALAVTATGIYALAKRNPALVMCVLAYLTGSEVLWRQSRAPLYYLLGPYLAIVLAGLGVVTLLGRLGRDGRLALLYVALLVPSAVVTINTAGTGAREIVSFALAGPVALALVVAFASQLRAEPKVYRRILWVLVVSAFGPFTVAVTNLQDYIATAGQPEFSNQSNFVASGGFGPVQVSSVLGLGVLAALLLVIHDPDRLAKLVAAAAGLALAAQALLTFSRGGMFSVAIAVAVLAVFEARDPRTRGRVLAVVVLALVAGYVLVVPRLDSFTEGAFQDRFGDTETGRTSLAGNDIDIFERNLAFGVGPGMTKYQRLSYETCQLRSDKCTNEPSSHTEVTRMLSEHGLPGLVAIVVLAVLVLHAARMKGPARVFALTWMAWAVAQTFYANLRIVAVPFIFGLAFLRISGGDDEDSDGDTGEADEVQDRAPAHARIGPGRPPAPGSP